MSHYFGEETIFFLIFGISRLWFGLAQEVEVRFLAKITIQRHKKLQKPKPPLKSVRLIFLDFERLFPDIHKLIPLLTAENVSLSLRLFKTTCFLSLSDDARESDFSDLLAELELLKKVNKEPHPNVIRFIGGCSLKGTYVH